MVTIKGKDRQLSYQHTNKTVKVSRVPNTMAQITNLLTTLCIFTIIAISSLTESKAISKDLASYLLTISGTSPVTMRRKAKLYSMASRQHLRVHGQQIDGLGKSSSPEARLIIESVGFGLVRIKGDISGHYVCFTKKGFLIGMKRGIDRHCIFREIFDIYDFLSYQSLANSQWYVGIRKSGKRKRGQKSLRAHKETQFLLRHW